MWWNLFGVLCGAAISILVSRYYFRRQFKAEILLRYAKLVMAYKRDQLNEMGFSEPNTFSDSVKVAMAEYKTYLEAFDSRLDVNEMYRQALNTARDEIQTALKSSERETK
jgi:hypothetical protein